MRVAARLAVVGVALAGAGLVTVAALPRQVAAVPAPLVDSSPVRAGSFTPSTGLPNIVLIVTDDQRAGSEAGMPNVERLLADKGVTYTNAFVPTSLCCPSRSSLLTGNFAHTNGIWENRSRSAWGGWPAFRHGGLEADTLATRLSSQGYRTGLFGKYLNKFGLAPPGYTPAGWDVWRAFGEIGRDYSTYRWSFEPRDVLSSGPRRYSTDVIADWAEGFIRTTSQDRPLFAYVTPFAPHAPFDTGPYAGSARRLGLLDDIAAATHWPNPAVNQADVSGYPSWVRGRPLVDLVDEEAPGVHLDQVLERQADALLGVDAAVGRIVEALDATGRLDNTILVFTSDNGYVWGEHRLTKKSLPYDASIKVPLIVRWDRQLAPGKVDDRVVAANIDVNASLSRAAKVPVTIDGRPIWGIAPQRTGGLLLEAEYEPDFGRPAYCGWRRADSLFVRYANGEEEYYDYATDPFEMINRARDPAYGAAVARSRELARDACRPTPPSFRWSGGITTVPDPAMNVVAEAGRMRGTALVSWRVGRTFGDPLPVMAVRARGTNRTCRLDPSRSMPGLECRFHGLKPGPVQFQVRVRNKAGWSLPALSNRIEITGGAPSPGR